MSICAPCRVPHTEQSCEDTLARRRGLARRCYCQHRPRQVVATEASPGPEPDTAHDVRVTRHTMTTKEQEESSSEYHRR